MSVVDEELHVEEIDKKKQLYPEAKFSQVNPLNNKSISVNTINDNDVNLEESKSNGSEKKKMRPKATTYGKITQRSQSIRVRNRKVDEINLKKLQICSKI